MASNTHVKALGDKVPLRKLMDALHTTYCGTVGVEYMHIPSREMANFLRTRVEKNFTSEVLKERRSWGRFLSDAERKSCLSRLHFAEMFETFLADRWNTAKRFGMEGVESCIPGLKVHMEECGLRR